METDAKRIITVEDSIMNEIIASIPSMKDAIKIAIRKSGMPEKTIAWELGIHPPQFSRIMVGEGNFPEDKLIKFMGIVNSYIPLQWMAYHCGFELRVMTKTLEEQLEQERQEKEEAQRKYEELLQALTIAGIKT